MRNKPWISFSLGLFLVVVAGLIFFGFCLGMIVAEYTVWESWGKK